MGDAPSGATVFGDHVGRIAKTYFVVAVLGLLVVALAGCGGSKTATQSSPSQTVPAVTIPAVKTVTLGKLAYDRTMKRLGIQLVGSVQRLFPLVEAQPGTEVSKESVAKLKKTRAVVTNVLARIAAIAPPADVRAEHQRLLQGVSALGGELDALINVEENGTSKPFGDFAHFDSLRTIAKARSAIEKKGYPIGG